MMTQKKREGAPDAERPDVGAAGAPGQERRMTARRKQEDASKTPALFEWMEMTKGFCKVPHQKWLSIPEAIRERARYLLLDTIGAALAGRSLHPTAQVRSLFSGRAPVSAGDVALTLGVSAQAADLDETNLRANAHIAAAIVPAAIATACLSRTAGADLLSALVAAYEFEARLGAAIAPRHGRAGWHPSATLGAFGAAFAASTIMGHDERTRESALGIAATQASGVKSVFGSSAKAFNLGRAAQSGLFSAQLAQAGMAPAQDAFSSENGFFDAAGALPFADTGYPRHPLLHNHFKFQPCCIETHAAASAAAEVAKRLSGRPTRILVSLSSTARPMVDHPEPGCMDQARFSVQYAVARALEAGSADVMPEPFRADLVERAPELIIDTDSELGHFCARVTGTMGNRSETATVDLGTSGDFDTKLIEEKFNRLSEPVLGNETDSLRHDLLALEEAGDTRDCLSWIVDLVCRTETTTMLKRASTAPHR